MSVNWILSPVTIYAVIAMALTGTLVLFITAKQEIQRALRAARDARQSVDGAVQEMSVGIEQLRAEMTEMSLPAPVSAPAAGPALNLTKRTQALRMLRRGESVESIASALRTPRNEIELLVKVQPMIQSPPLA